MKNLKVFFSTSYTNDLFSKCNFIVFRKQCVFASTNVKVGEAFVLCNNALYNYNFYTNENTLLTDFSDDGKCKAVNMWYRDWCDETVSICFENGEIKSLAFDSEGIKAIKDHILGCNVNEIHWSPDEEIALVVNSSHKLSIFNSALINIGEIDLFDTSVCEKELINVGWGKKETQFHGSEGKEAALKASIDVDSNLVDDSHSLKTTWCGDSSLFAVGYWCPISQKRTLKIFNCDGVLQSISENIAGEYLNQIYTNI